MKIIYSSGDDIDIKMLEGLLDSEQIEYQVTSDGAGDYLRITGANISMTKRVLVREQDYDKAMNIAKTNNFVVDSNTTQKEDVTRQNNPKALFARAMLIILFLAFFVYIVLQFLV